MSSTIRRLLLAGSMVIGSLQGGGAVAGGVEPFMGTIMWVPYNFAPKNWALCDGSLLPIAQNQALFSLLGTTYGGNGVTTFALPNFQGRLLVKEGQGPGLSSYTQGQTGGEAAHTLSINEMPVHTHNVNVSTDPAAAATPTGNVYAQAASGNLYSAGPPGNMVTATAPAGGGQPHNNMMPYTTLNCIIALQGIFPSRP